jgi:protein involved in polysaccharide export with SLBB domain
MRVVLTIVAFWIACTAAVAQDNGSGDSVAARVPDAGWKLRLAMSSAAYPVTPEDDYRLAFQQGNALSTLEILVGSDYVIRLNVLGEINAAGMTFTQVKQIIEKAFAAAYPQSLPSLTIASVGVFQVFIKGEMAEARNVDAWAMSQLSDILEGRLGAYSCLRNIRVISRDGTEKQYDLFRFQRLGLEDQNPYMRPGDKVVVSTAERSVEVAGEVRKPGKYQLLALEELKEMIDFFGGGLTASAMTSNIRIKRVSGEKPNTLYVDLNQEDGSSVPLEDGDVVTIPSKSDALSVVFFEGAVTPETPQTTVPVLVTESSSILVPLNYNSIRYSFTEGETLKTALESVRKSIPADADLSSSFIIREGKNAPIPVNLMSLLTETAISPDFLLQPFDRIFIPTARYSVAVYGDVARPGYYQYLPTEHFRHYAGLAGFADVEDIPDNIVIMDSQGQRHPAGDVIGPGSRIFFTSARVAVQGAVVNPGNFPFHEGFSTQYYINNAGGFDFGKSTGKKVTIFDSKGNQRMTNDSVQPGDRIFIADDKFEYWFLKEVPLLLPVITAVSLMVTTYLALSH